MEPPIPSQHNHQQGPGRSLPFLALSKLFEAVANTPKQPLKAKFLDQFRSRHIDPVRSHADDLYEVYRLLCPDVSP